MFRLLGGGQLLQGPALAGSDRVASADLPWVKSCCLASVALDFPQVRPHLGDVEALLGHGVSAVLGGGIAAHPQHGAALSLGQQLSP